MVHKLMNWVAHLPTRAMMLEIKTKDSSASVVLVQEKQQEVKP